MMFSSHCERSAFKRKLRQKELVVGTWVNAIKDPMIIKILGGVGLDYVMIDMEHSGATLATVSEMCTLARECGLYPLVRPDEPNDLKMNGRLLDAGALGLVIPHIDSPRQAQAIVNSMKFFNGGTRGYCSRIAGSGFEKMDEAAMRFSDEEVSCVVQFESEEAIGQADQILSIPGVDVAIVGRGDLAHSMGLSGKTTDPAVSALVEQVYASARAQDKTPGLLVNDLEGAKKWLDRQIRFLTFGSEVGWLISSYKNGLGSIHRYLTESGAAK